jgi:uncharacterized membrane protein
MSEIRTQFLVLLCLLAGLWAGAFCFSLFPVEGEMLWWHTPWVFTAITIGILVALAVGVLVGYIVDTLEKRNERV